MNSTTHRFARLSTLAVSALLLAACGGGGGGTGGPLNNPIGSVGNVIPTPTPTPSITTASGKLVDDSTGAPLAGIPVKIAPWTAGATPLPSPQTTTAADGSFTFTAPNGHYLLVIGSDSASDTTRATIHDNITLNGGAQALNAPTLPPVPTVTPPAWEKSGVYRLGTVDATACFNEYNSLRVSRSLPPTVLDEWLTESSRDVEAYHLSPAFSVNVVPPFITMLGSVIAAGGNGCTQFANGTSTVDPNYFNDARVLWYGGRYVVGVYGVAQYLIDPRAFTESGYPWP